MLFNVLIFFLFLMQKVCRANYEDVNMKLHLCEEMLFLFLK
jgi:hypothetical protein